MKKSKLLLCILLLLIPQLKIYSQDSIMVDIKIAENLAIHFAKERWPEKDVKVVDYQLYYQIDSRMQV